MGVAPEPAHRSSPWPDICAFTYTREDGATSQGFSCWQSTDGCNSFYTTTSQRSAPLKTTSRSSSGLDLS